MSSILSGHFTELYEYDSASNRQILNLLTGIKEAEGRIHQIFAHLLMAKKVWITRLRGEDSSSTKIWPELSWDDCSKLIDENSLSYREFLRNKPDEDLESVVIYKNSKGTEFRTPARDILTHVIIHGGYHRGQIATAVRKLGFEPVNTDYITYVRSR